MVRLFAFALVITSAFPGVAQSTAVPDSLEQEARAAADTCKKAVRYDKQLEDLQNRTICYQAVVQGDRYALKMLHRSTVFGGGALRLYLDTAIPAATPDLEADPHHTKRLQRQQAAFWRKNKDAGLDLLFLQDNAGLPYRIAKETQKGKIAEIIVHFQKGLNSNIEPTPTGAPLAGRYLLSMPVGTWLIDDFEPIRLRTDEPLDWMTDYIHYARSARGNPVSLEFIALAEQPGLQHFWLDGRFESDGNFLSRNHDKGFSVMLGEPGSEADYGGMRQLFEVGFDTKEANDDGYWTIDPQERGLYQIVKKGEQWFIATFEELISDENYASSSADDDRLVFNNLSSVTKYLLQSQTLTAKLRTCEPSEFTISEPTVPDKQYQYSILGPEGDLCRFKVVVIGAIGLHCRASSEAIDAHLTLLANTARQLEQRADGDYPIDITLDHDLQAKLSDAMNRACEMTVDEQPPLDMEEFVNNSLTYFENLKTCNPSTYSYPHPMIPGFIGRNVIKGYKGNDCLIDMHMPNNIIVQCKASGRHVELMHNQGLQMLKDLQESGRYEFSIKIDLSSGVNSSELSDLMVEECQW